MLVQHRYEIKSKYFDATKSRQKQMKIEVILRILFLIYRSAFLSTDTRRVDIPTSISRMAIHASVGLTQIAF